MKIEKITLVKRTWVDEALERMGNPVVVLAEELLANRPLLKKAAEARGELRRLLPMAGYAKKPNEERKDNRHFVQRGGRRRLMVIYEQAGATAELLEAALHALLWKGAKTHERVGLAVGRFIINHDGPDGFLINDNGECTYRVEKRDLEKAIILSLELASKG